MEIEFADYDDYQNFMNKLRLEGALGYMRHVACEITSEKFKTSKDVYKKIDEDWLAASRALSDFLTTDLKWAGWTGDLFEPEPKPSEKEMKQEETATIQNKEPEQQN